MTEFKNHMIKKTKRFLVLIASVAISSLLTYIFMSVFMDLDDGSLVFVDTPPSAQENVPSQPAMELAPYKK